MISREKKNYALTKYDFRWILLIVIIYGVLSFINLGTLTNPQTFWSPEQDGNYVVLSLDQKTDVSQIRHFSGARFGGYKVYISDDNKDFRYIGDLEQEKVFNWADMTFNESFQYIAIEAKDVKSIMGDLCIYDQNNNPLRLTAVTENGKALVDEMSTVPEEISYLNSTYFDEIYHARTAYEYLEGLDIYEWTHPPLGKLIMAIPIKFMGMNTFSYRLMGNLAGIAMLIVIYIFAKRLFGQTKYALLAGVLLAADGMHFVQTRIATVDCFLVLFILLAYLFMYQYVKCDDSGPISHKLMNLLFSGIFMGAAIATKWNGAYCAIGLAIMFFINFFKRTNAGFNNHIWRQQAIKIILCCLVFFIFIPIGIYLLSYTPFFLKAEGNPLEAFWKLQLQMYHYHADLVDTHPYTSPWYLWPLDIKPVWYYQGKVPEGSIASIVAHGNPIIWWSGIFGMLYAFKEAIIEREKEYVFISIAILAVYLPYVFVPRIMFLYHYFPVVPLMILALVGLIKEMSEKLQNPKLAKWYGVLCIIIFAFFYPIYSGMTIPRWYGMITEWLPVWHFY